MNDWHSTYLGRGALPRELSGFEIEAFFTYSELPERRSPLSRALHESCDGLQHELPTTHPRYVAQDFGSRN
jgi:hypothetical protein